MFVGTRALEVQPAFSPDGRWIAYMSDESGTFEVYVRPFPGPGGRWQISIGGGSSPRWSLNGPELIYQTPARRIMRIEYTAKGDVVAAGKSRPWAALQLADLGGNGAFDVAPDGKHPAAILPTGVGSGEKAPTELTFLLNFFEEVKRRAK